MLRFTDAIERHTINSLIEANKTWNIILGMLYQRLITIPYTYWVWLIYVYILHRSTNNDHMGNRTMNTIGYIRQLIVFIEKILPTQIIHTHRLILSLTHWRLALQRNGNLKPLKWTRKSSIMTPTRNAHVLLAAASYAKIFLCLQLQLIYLTADADFWEYLITV